MKLLIFGDVFGKLGRAGVKIMLPKWREKFSPDVVIANIENIAHGKGIGIKQINELKEAGVNIFTGGNHSLEGKDFEKVLNDETVPVLRPANIPASPAGGPNAPGRGALVYEVKTTGKKLLVINLIGQVFMRSEYENPFLAADKILEEYGNETPYKILDWHADATSEKTVMGWYLDGKVSAVFGTHSHVPTADAKILPKGTAYISDIGMVGPLNSVIGVEIEPSIKRFKDKIKTKMDPIENGPIEVNAIFVELEDDTARSELCRTVDIRHLREIIPAGKI
ncbi:MAG: TIGR00282 family metallophosphoesterase [Candidatus Giovannonibacteria bacterium]|nr:TIGR00282 family metallophosphoesterase [Candidatus Giovannonibacteria bacterium]